VLIFACLLCVWLFPFFQNARLQFNDNTAERRRWGGGIMGSKAQAVIKARERAVAREAASKA
jgi:large subunit ribosomal protein L7Ae